MKSFDVRSYLAELGYNPESRSQGKFFYVNCPDCDHDGPHLWIRTDNGVWGCWKNRNHRGGPVHLVMHLERLDYPAARARTAKFYTHGSVVVEERTKKLEFKEIGLPEGLIKADDSREAMEFLRKRGFTIQTVKDWNLYYAKNTRYKGLKFKQRIIIPIYHNGRIVAFQGRDITGKQKIKYMTSPPDENAAPLTKTVYNIDRVNPNLVVVTEGVLDAWAVGKDCGVCLFGKKVYPEQLTLFDKKGVNNVIICLDGEAISESQHIAHDLSVVVSKVEVMELPIDEDPASLGNKEIWRMITDE